MTTIIRSSDESWHCSVGNGCEERGPWVRSDDRPMCDGGTVDWSGRAACDEHRHLLHIELDDELAEDGDEDPRTFADIALHAGIVVEDLQALSPVLLAKGDTATRHLASIVERLAAQVAELAERLDRQP